MMYKKIAVLVLIVCTTMSFLTIERSVYKAVASESIVEWVGYKTAGAHNGTIGIKEGTLLFEEDQIIGGEFTIDMSSIEVLDTQNKKLLKHLVSDDFFDVEKFSTAKFSISESSMEAGKTILKGQLTIKGITQEIQIPVSVTKSEKGRMILESETFKIDRTKFNITYKSKTVFNNLKDKFIHDKFDMKVKVVLDIIAK